MKNLITSIACVMLLMAFVIQFVQQQILFQQIAEVNQAVNAFEETLDGEKQFKHPNYRELKNMVGSIMGCSEESVVIKTDHLSSANEAYFTYQLQFPIMNILAVPAFWGVEEQHNQTVYTITRRVKR